MSKTEDNKENKSIIALKTLIKEAILLELYTDKAFIKSQRRHKRFKKQFEDKDQPANAKSVKIEEGDDK